jgi:surface protein
VGILNTIITTALCITMAIGTPPPRQGENPLTSTPQTQQTNNPSYRSKTPGTIAQRSTTPHAAPASQTTGTPDTQNGPEPATPTPTATPAQLRPQATNTTLGAPTAPLAPAAPPNNNATGPQNQTGTTHKNSIGPQDGTCTPTSGTWGTPANDTLVNQVPDRDPATVQWDIDTQCTLTIHHGTSPNYSGNNRVPWSPYRSQITKVRIDGNLTLHTTDPTFTEAFINMTALHEVRIDGTLHFSQKASSNVFANDSALTAFTGTNPAGFETSQATDMSFMFNGCSSLTTLDVTHFNTTNTTSMRTMFQNCSSLTTLDVTHFNTTNTTNMRFMFYGCSSLTTLDVTHFNTTNTTNMRTMFNGCTKLTSIDLSAFDTRRALDLASVQYMLNNTPGLRELWLGPHTYLTKTGTEPSDSRQNALGNTPYDVWVEVPTSGPRIPVPDMRARTALGTGTNPQGHYIIPILTLTVDYNNAQTNHTQTITIRTTTAGSRFIDWGTRPAPAGKVFDGWDLHTTDTGHVTTTGNTVAWSEKAHDPDAKITARWRTLGQPTIAVNVHADGGSAPWGGTEPWAEVSAEVPAGDWRDSDTIELKSLDGIGATTTCTTRTCTVRLAVGQLRDSADWDAAYRLTATLSAADIRTDPAGTTTGNPADKQGILPYTTINYHTGTGATGTPPATGKALTDTDSRKALLTIAGPDTITRPAHNLFTAWQANHAAGAPGTARPGLSPVPTSLGDTDGDGRTAVELTATWTLLATPGISAVRANDGTISVTGTSKPHHAGDTIRVCHPDAAGATRCRDITPDTNGPSGALPYDGNTEHPWSITLPADTPADAGTINATLNSDDTNYTPQQPVQSETGSINVPPIYHQTLPLTGGLARPALAALATALAAALLLTATATRLRNHRRKARHRTTATGNQGR